MKKIILLILVSFSVLAVTQRPLDFDIWRSVDRTKVFTPPSSTDTLVGRNSNDTLKNKSIDGLLNTLTNITATNAVDDTFSINDSSDPTKKLTFNVAGTSGTLTTIYSNQTANRLLTLPDQSTTLVGELGAQTLYDKTIFSPTISGHPTVEGVTSTGATGSGKFVFDTSPSLITPSLGVATATSINGTSIPSSKTLQDKDTLTTKGDLYVATGPATVARQAVGSNGQVIVADSAQTNGIKYANPSIKAKTDNGTDQTLEKLVVPDGSLVSLGANSYALDLSNSLAVDSSFESADPVTNAGWSLTNAGTPSVSTTYKDNRNQSLYIPASVSGTGAIATLDVSANAAGLKGQQGAVAISVRRDNVAPTATVTVCARIDGVTSTTNCVSIPPLDANNPFKRVVLPVVMGGTSTGVSIKATGFEGYYLDSLYIGQGLPLQNVSGAQLLGTLKVTGCSSDWSTTSGSMNDFSTQTGCTYTGTGSLIAPSTNIPAVKINGTISAGKIVVEYEGMLRNGTSNANSYFQFYDLNNSSYAKEISTFAPNNAGTTVTANKVGGSFEYSTSQTNLQLNLRGYSTTSYVGGTTANPGVFKVYYYPPDSKIFSTASPDYAYTNAGTITIGATTTAPSKGTIVTDRIMASRKGQNLIAEYQYAQSSAGSNGSGDYLFSLPSGLSFDSNIVGFYTGSAPTNGASGNLEKSIVGYGKVAGDTTPYYTSMLIAYSATQFRVLNTYGSGGNLFVGSSLTSLGFANAVFNFRLNAPIQGWQDYGVIVGSFAGIEKCANDYECTDTFSAKVDGSGNVSGENLEWINGGCTYSAGVCALTFQTYLKDGTSPLTGAMNCAATMDGTATATILRISSNTTSGITLNNIDRTGTSQNAPFEIKCQKAGQDYKPKTAKVATSIGVAMTPTMSLPKIFSMTVGSTCAITHQEGDNFTLSTGTAVTSNCTYTMNRFSSAPTCFAGQIGGTSGSSMCRVSFVPTSTSLTIDCNSGTPSVSVFCYGNGY